MCVCLLLGVSPLVTSWLRTQTRQHGKVYPVVVDTGGLKPYISKYTYLGEQQARASIGA